MLFSFIGGSKTREPFDPDHYRMTVGEHLEELRRRLIFALGGFVLTLIVCLIFGRRVLTAFCAPLVNTLLDKGLNPALFYTELSDGFMVFIQISVISAAAISAPWILYQFWLFIASGLYPHERRMVTKYTPLSLALLIVGMLFVYFAVLPWTIHFFIEFGNSIPLPQMQRTGATIPVESLPILAQVPILEADPAQAADGSMWFNTQDGRLKVMVGQQPRIVQFGASNLLSPHITLPDYINLVIMLLIVFGLSFQLPLVVVAVVRARIVPHESLKKFRQYVYFGIVVMAAIITPGDYVTGTVLLMIPLMLLYELGIWLARPRIDQQPQADA